MSWSRVSTRCCSWCITACLAPASSAAAATSASARCNAFRNASISPRFDCAASTSACATRTCCCSAAARSWVARRSSSSCDAFSARHVSSDRRTHSELRVAAGACTTRAVAIGATGAPSAWPLAARGEGTASVSWVLCTAAMGDTADADSPKLGCGPANGGDTGRMAAADGWRAGTPPCACTGEPPRAGGSCDSMRSDEPRGRAARLDAAVYSRCLATASPTPFVAAAGTLPAPASPFLGRRSSSESDNGTRDDPDGRRRRRRLRSRLDTGGGDNANVADVPVRARWLRRRSCAFAWSRRWRCLATLPARSIAD